jgi:nicotinamidase/pyrazinamidase
VAPIAAMISAAAAAGASVIASRDYHPIDHASFTVFPSHCVQVGFYTVLISSC